MNSNTTLLLAIGTLFLVGLIADLVGRKTGVPRVTLLLIFGILAGPTGFDAFPTISDRAFELTCDITLAFVAFLLGATFNRRAIKQLGSKVLILSAIVTLMSALVVALVAIAFGLPIIVALVLGAIATATDPIATRDVTKTHPNQGPFTKQLLGVVAIDDAWGIIAFSLVLATAQVFAGQDAIEPILHCFIEIGGSILLGLVLGIPMAFLTGRIEQGEPTLIEALGFVLICAGVSEYLGFSMLLSAMTMGAITANFASHHNRPFQAIEGIEWPLLIGFFFLTGATLRIDNFNSVAMLVGIYVASRIAGRIAGGLFGALIIKESALHGRWLGAALLPQAGVALGMALVAHNNFPELGETILPGIVLSTVIFELIGPLITRRALDSTT